MEDFDSQKNKELKNIKRDGAQDSLWQHKVPSFHNEIISNPDSTIYDVIIVGGGITGITTGLLLQKEGKKVLIAEAHTVCFGTTSGTTAHINSFLDIPYYKVEEKFGEENTKKVYSAVQGAVNLISANVKQYNIDCGHTSVNGYIYAQDEKEEEELDKILQGFLKVDIQAKYVKDIPVKIPFTKAIEIPKQAQFHPTRYVYSLVQEFLKLGGVLMENTMITDVENNDEIVAFSDKREFRAKNLIYATHIPPGVNLMHFRNAPYRSYVIAFKLQNETEYPNGLAYDLKDPYHYYRTQMVDGEKYFIAGGEDHKTAHDDNTAERFDCLETYIKQFYNIEKIAYKWSSQFYEPTDGLPYIGHLIGQPKNVFVATGYSGIGMVNSHIAAKLLTDIILERENEYEELFSPSRVKPIAGFKKFVKEGADVVGELVSGIMPSEKLESESELKPNEGKVVNYEGKTVALYKDENGNLHAVDSLCTHIKCTIAWNVAEKSWDCPCHGSRFSMSGEVLTGPAQKNLERIALDHKE